ncbi:MAG: hypothetical protein WCV63_04910 [Negativicutes bacterium]|jgi:hypothetical protein
MKKQFNPKWLIIALIVFLAVHKVHGEYISLHTIFGIGGNVLLYFPLFVYALIIYIGLSLINKWRPAVITVKRLAFTPVMFLILTLPAVIGGKYHDTALLCYITGMVGVFILSMLIHKRIDIQADKIKKLIAIPADPIIIFATLFCVGNGIATGYLGAINSPLMKSGWLVPIMAFVSAAIAGHRIAKSLSFYLKYRQAPHTNLEKTK